MLQFHCCTFLSCRLLSAVCLGCLGDSTVVCCSLAISGLIIPCFPPKNDFEMFAQSARLQSIKLTRSKNCCHIIGHAASNPVFAFLFVPSLLLGALLSIYGEDELRLLLSEDLFESCNIWKEFAME